MSKSFDENKYFYFIRHGQTDWNAERRCMGQKDIALNEEGARQAREAAISLNNIAFNSICFSPLKRAADTAKIIAANKAVTLQEFEELKEQCYGIFEGMLTVDIKKMRTDKGDTYWPDDAEKDEEFNLRITTLIDKVMQLPAPALVVSHSGVYKALLNIMRTKHAPIDLENCVAVKFSHDKPSNEWKVDICE